MKLEEIQSILDTEFRIRGGEENLNDFAVTGENAAYVTPDFLSRKTALMTANAEDIEIVLTSVFITEEIVERSLEYERALIVTHHNFDYFEDERGLRPITPSSLERLRQHQVSIYVAHAPLDTHPVYGTSRCLAELCNIGIDTMFYDYYGSPTALIGTVSRTPFDGFAEDVRVRLERPALTLQKHSEHVSRIAVVAGGGDLPDLLQQIHDYGCDTYLTGTVEHRWGLPFIQEANRKFHELNAHLMINLIGGSHFGTERPAMIRLVDFFRKIGIRSTYVDDVSLLGVR
jgi:putative NIF3 family GTP cyclohydrolase 1 type 2